MRRVVEGANCIFHEIHKENDFGVDAFIEFVDDERVLGNSIAVQIKSGSSYCTEKTCSVPADRPHFEYWANHSLTVLGIVYDPSDRCAYWINITDYLKGNRNLILAGPYSITFSKTDLHKFDSVAFDKVFLPLFLRKPLLLDFETSKAWALDEDYPKHSFGIRTLLYRHRNDVETWDIYFQLLRERPIEITDPYLVYILAHIPGQPDIFWHKNNKLEPQLRQEILSKMQAFSFADVAKLLSFVGGGFPFGRGSLGQNVNAIVEVVADREVILREIAEDTSLSYGARSQALLLYAHYEPRGFAASLQHLMRSSEDPIGREVQELVEYLEDSDYRPIPLD